MALHKTVPTRIRVLGHAGLVYHPGQACTCFHCGAVSHELKRCPKKATPPKQKKRKQRSKTSMVATTTTEQPSHPGSSTSVPPEVSDVDDPPRDVGESNQSIPNLDPSNTATQGKPRLQLPLHPLQSNLTHPQLRCHARPPEPDPPVITKAATPSEPNHTTAPTEERPTLNALLSDSPSDQQPKPKLYAEDWVKQNLLSKSSREPQQSVAPMDASESP